jgi:hypothetical protein
MDAGRRLTQGRLMSVEDPSHAFHGGEVGARVASILDGANRDAAAIAADAEADARELLAEAHDEALDGFKAVADAAREVALERARTLATLRCSIAERCESLILEADEPDHVREQVESLLLALSETEALLIAGPGPEREPTVPETLRAAGSWLSGRGARAAEPVSEPAEERSPAPTEPSAITPEPAPGKGDHGDGPFSRWRQGRMDGQLLALMRMAVGGMTREQIAGALDPALDPREREALLDDVFGRPEKAGQRPHGNGGGRIAAATNRA